METTSKIVDIFHCSATGRVTDNVIQIMLQIM